MNAPFWRRSVAIAVMALALPLTARAAAEDDAGDVSEVDKDRVGPLRERIPPVSGFLMLRKGRFEVSPGLAISVKDAFFTKYLLGASLTYHATEQLGFGLRLGLNVPTLIGGPAVSGAAQICETTGTTVGCRAPT